VVLQVLFDRFYRFHDTGTIILSETSDPVPVQEADTVDGAERKIVVAE
jgi:hypothetical protein